MKILEIKVLCLLLVLRIADAMQNFYYEKGVVDSLSSCPGQYCGRTILENDSWSDCGACERGFRRNSSSACEACNDSPIFYDWLYLGFTALLPLTFHLVSIDIDLKGFLYKTKILIVYAMASFEVGFAAIVSLLIFEPRGSLTLSCCKVRYLSDWYSIFHNPNPNYEGLLHCTQEAVYPLYSIVFVFYTLCLVVMLMVRPWLAPKLLPGDGKVSIYAGMYFLPGLIVVHALCGGLIYYSFPYLIIIMSVISNAAYFAFQFEQTMHKLFWGTIRNGRRLMILGGHWFLHAYGIIAITELQYPALVVLVPLPSLFYILTSTFSQPSIFQ